VRDASKVVLSHYPLTKGKREKNFFYEIKRFKTSMFTGLVRFVRLKYFSFFLFLVLKSLLKRVKLISKIENPRKDMRLTQSTSRGFSLG